MIAQFIIIYWIFSLFGNAVIYYLSYLDYKRWREKEATNAMVADIYIGSVFNPKTRKALKKIRVLLPLILIYIIFSPFLFPTLLLLLVLYLLIKYKKKKAENKTLEERESELAEQVVDWMDEINEAFPDSVLPPVENTPNLVDNLRSRIILNKCPIRTIEDYEAAQARIDELIAMNPVKGTADFIELDWLGNMVVDYEEKNHKIDEKD